MTKIFLDNIWQDYDYDLLYTTRGYTTTKSIIVSVYEEDFTLLEAWRNSGFIWIEKDHQWYPSTNVPYYIYSNASQTLYRLEEVRTYPLYTNDGEIYLDDNHHFTTIQELHDTQGLTETPSDLIIVFSDEMALLEAWSNSGFNWIEKDSRWYPEDETPYYVKQNESRVVYYIDQAESYPLFKKNNEEFLLKNSQLVTYQYLHDNLGYTLTASSLIEVYDEYLTRLDAWINSDFIWIDDDEQWYSYSSVPYYVKTNTYQTLYRINVGMSYQVYNKGGAQYLLDNNHFTTAQELYDNSGYTTTESTVVLAYSDPSTLLESWSNSGLTWVDRDHCWYNNNSVPYYVRQSGNKILYYIDQEESYPLFKKNNTEFILKDSQFIDPQYLHDYFGYTTTPSEVYLEEQGMVVCWYNQNEELPYWNNITKEWAATPPESGTIGELAFTTSTFAVQTGSDVVAYVQERYPDIKVVFPNLYPGYDEP